MPPERPPRILVLVQSQQAYGRDIIEGIIRWARHTRRWELLFDTRIDPAAHTRHTDRQIDGIIAESRSPERRKWLEGLRVAKVVISGEHPVPGSVWVQADNRRVGTMAFDHLYELGLRRFAYCGYEDAEFSTERLAGFKQAMQKHRLEAQKLEVHLSPRQPGDFEPESPELIPWVQGLAKPVGVFAVTLDRARNLALACREGGVLVPEQVAIIGVNNDPLVAEMADPPVTGIDHGTVEIGYRGAEALDQLLRGEPTPSSIKIEPVEIQARQSTDILAINHPDVAQAVRLIRERALDGLTVKDILKQIPVSRRMLEQAFRQTLGRTIHQEITRVRMQHVEQLLRETSLDLPQIAVRSGYRYGSQLSAAFRKHMGMSPRAYRAEHATS